MSTGPVIIKKYANRRLYDTDTSSYITLDDLCAMVKKGVEFTVLDAKTEEDLTRQVLTQIIFDQESKGYSLLPVKFLRTIISFYDGKMQKFLPPYLEASMEHFSLNQDKMFNYFNTGNQPTSFLPFAQFEEIGKQNMALFTKAFSMFNPFDAVAKSGGEAEQPIRKAAGGSKK
jgi:polyhydroxyalkanoate synthesis repressor PhaR